MLALFLSQVAEDKFPFTVDLKSDGQTFSDVGRADFKITVDGETGELKSVFRFESSDRDVKSYREDVYDREGRLVRTKTSQTLSEHPEIDVELKKEGGKWSLMSKGEKQKDDFPATITDSSILWWHTIQPKKDTKVELSRFDGGVKVEKMTAVYHGVDAHGHKVERWNPGFNELTWYTDKGQVARMEVSYPPDSSRMIFRRNP